MTHISKFRYGPTIIDQPSAGRSSELRIRYFDPRTGKPCKEKPKPLEKRERVNNSYERNVKKMADIKEAEEIMRNMATRKKQGNNRYGKHGRPVVVDGVRYESVTAASVEVGTSPQYLGLQLRNGNTTVYGHKVKFAEVESE